MLIESGLEDLFFATFFFFIIVFIVFIIFFFWFFFLLTVGDDVGETLVVDHGFTVDWGNSHHTVKFVLGESVGLAGEEITEVILKIEIRSMISKITLLIDTRLGVNENMCQTKVTAKVPF